jgi:hypothetical protein
MKPLAIAGAVAGITLLYFVLTSGSVGTRAAAVYDPSGPGCQRVLMGALAGQPWPLWCYTSKVAGLDTHQESSNAWIDDFEHGQSLSQLSNAYAQGFLGDGRAEHWQHASHWMVDIGADGSGKLIGAWMRPNRSFSLQSDGSLVVEFEVAGPIAGTRSTTTLSDSWPEIVISEAPNPPGVQSWGSALRRNGTYLYEAFPGSWTFGCRMQQSKHPICALYQNDFGTAGTSPSRVYEINQNGGEVTDEFGGGPHQGTGDFVDVAWKGCNSTQDADTICRNMFRMEITPTRFRLFANGVRIYEAGLINSELGKILNKPFYVYFGDFAYRMDAGAGLRFHWDHVAVNPNPSGSTPLVSSSSAGSVSQASSPGSGSSAGTAGLAIVPPSTGTAGLR